MQLSLIQSKIHEVRGQKVMLDFDLAQIYEVETRVLKQVVKRNLTRFPKDFMFHLSKIEIKALVSQSVIPSKSKLGGAIPYAFTEQGVAMLSSVLNSEKAIEVNIAIIRTFVAHRQSSQLPQEFEQILLDAGRIFHKSQSEVYSVLESILKMIKRTRTNRSENLSALKQTYQRELIQKILLRRLR